MNVPERSAAADSLQAPPHSIEAEQSVLGALLLDNDGFDRIGALRCEHFYRYDHRLIFEAIQALVLAAREADVMTVFDALQAKAHEVGGLAYLNALARGVPGSAAIARYAEIVVNRWKLRGLLGAAGEVEALVRARGARTVDELIDLAQQKFERLGEAKIAAPQRVGLAMMEVVEHIDAQCQGTAKPTGVMTGFADLDAKTGGLGQGDLVVVAGRPAMGKTALAFGIGEYVAETAGTVLVFSMEMPAKQLNQRTLSRLSGIPLQRVKDGAQFLDDDWPRLTRAVRRVAEMPLYIDDSSHLSLMEVTNRSRAVKRKHGLRLIVIDYLGLMAMGQGERHDLQIGAITAGLKALAKQLEVPIILLSQLNRALEQRPNKRPQMSDLRDSGSIEQDADTVLFIYRDEVYHADSADKGIAEIIIGKQRNGAPGRIALAFFGEHTRFADLAPGTLFGAAPESRPSRKGFEE
jgi:replicative DNA helicase